MLIMKELERCYWLKGRAKQLMLIRMTREKFEGLVGCHFKELGDELGKEWATGFYLESIGQIAIIQYEAFPDLLEVLVEPDIDPIIATKILLAEFRLSQEWIESP
jgi:hypothetical protein